MTEIQSEQSKVEGIASYADAYQEHDFGMTVSEFGMNDPHELLEAHKWTVLKFVFRFRIFEDAAAVFGQPALSAVEQLDETDEIDPDELWETFKRVCQDEYGYDLFKDKTESVMKGTAILYNQHGHFIHWIEDEVAAGNIDVVYEAFADIKWVGPKITKFIIRDFVWLLDEEDAIPKADAHYLHPIDGWVRSVSETIWPPLQGENQDAISRHLARKCCDHDVPHIAFNQGAFYFGAKDVGDDAQLESRLESLTGSM